MRLGEFGNPRIGLVVAAGHDQRPVRRGGPCPDRAARAGRIFLPGALADDAAEQLPGRGQRNHAQQRPPGLDQPDIGREAVEARGEFARAVQRVHQPEAPTRRGGDEPGLELLLGHHRIGGAGAQPLHDQRLGDAVGGGDGAGVALLLDREARLAHRHHRRRGLAGELRGEGEQGFRFHAAALPLRAAPAKQGRRLPPRPPPVVG